MPLRILFIEDSESVRTLLCRDMERYAEVTPCEHLRCAREEMDRQTFDCVVADLSLNNNDPELDSRPRETIQFLATIADKLPVVVCTGYGSGMQAQELSALCAAAGVYEFLDKLAVIRDPELLWLAIQRALTRHTHRR